MGVKVIADGAQVAVTVFEGGRFEDDVVLKLANEALRVAPETGFDRWTGGLVARHKEYADGTPDYTVTVLFVKVKKRK